MSILERVIAEIREETVDRKTIERAAARVWGGLRIGGVDVEVQPLPYGRGSIRRWPRLAWAAAAVLVAVGGMWLAAPAGALTVQSVDGMLYRVSDRGIAPATVGEWIAEGQAIRTAKGARALVRLENGSMIEMNERSELSIRDRWFSTNVRLVRGNIIVQAAKRRLGALRVATDDCVVSVAGTQFAVSRGTKGSRVSVIEGEVRVAQGGDQRVLRPGEQVTTSSTLDAVSVRDEIAWSRNLDVHLALLREMAKVEKDLEDLPRPGLRYSTRLLDATPAGTVFYAAFPNVSSTLAEAHRMLLERISGNDALRQWWQDAVERPGSGPKFDEMIQHIRTFGEYLGDEIAIVIVRNGEGQTEGPLFLAEIKKPGFGEYVQRELPRDAGMRMYVRGDLVAASPSLEALRRFAGGRTSAGTPFHAKIAEAYRGGAEWLLCADLEGVGIERMDLLNARYVVIERKQKENRAAVSFDDTRRGVPSWLAAPGSMGSLDFISQDASFAAAFVVKNPALAVEDLFQYTGKLAQVESDLGLSLRQDVAAPLGGEFAVALDGPALPSPAWKLVVEVYDPARLQSTIEHLAERSQGRLRVTREQAAGRTFYTISTPKLNYEAHYIFANGYLIAAPSRALLTRALQFREAGYALPRSSAFKALLPRDGHVNFSAVLYQNVGSILAPLAKQGNALLTDEQQQSLQALAGEMKPGLLYAYAEPERIVLASTDQAGVLGLNLSGLAAFGPLHGFLK